VFAEATNRNPTLANSDLAIIVRVSRDGFTCETKTWILRHDWFAFTQQLSILEETRSCEAHVESMSPGELALTVKSIDGLGHLGIEGVVGKLEFDRELKLQFSLFAFDPGQIVEFARDARKISETLG
jgi:hypothetical protein